MKRIFNLALIGLLLVFCDHAFAIGDQPVSANAKASISGKVIDNKTNESLVGVAISIEGTDIKAYTNLDGTFNISNIDPGNYNLILSLISYKNSLVENLKVNPGEKEVIDIKLDVIR
ncbi:MAG: carboxypeptidase-like regulatory domain-containing protein [Lentimicrobiaceae bacterium]|jgi:hypothetical protein